MPALYVSFLDVSTEFLKLRIIRSRTMSFYFLCTKVQSILVLPHLRLVPPTSFALATALMAVRYGKPQFLLKSTVRTFCKGTVLCTLLEYAY